MGSGRTHVVPRVRTGEAMSLPGDDERLRPPSLAAPWMAAGVGIAALVAMPEASATEIAGAATIETAAGALAPETTAFTRTLGETSLLTASAEHRTPPSAAAAIDREVLDAARRAAIESTYGSPIVAAAIGEPLWGDHTFASAPTMRPEPTAEQWEALRTCEATGDYAALNDSGKYRGAYQFDQPTWESVGGVGDPAEADPAEQDLRASLLFQQRGDVPWPECGRHLR